MKLIAFDLDGTLLITPSSWYAVHESFQVNNDQNLEDFTKGRINYEEFMKRDIDLWLKKNGRVHIDQIKNILLENLDLRIRRDALDVIQKLRENGHQVAIISGGIDIVANEVAKKLSIPHVFANGIRIDENGYLTGEGIMEVDITKKGEILKELADKLKINISDVVAVGDSIYDKDLFDAAGLSIIITDNDEIADIANSRIKNLNEILDLI